MIKPNAKGKSQTITKTIMDGVTYVAHADVLDDTVEPWERQPNESILWYTRFQMYLQMPVPRYMTQAIRSWAPNETVGRGNPADLFRYTARWRWKERAEAWDEHQLTLDRKAIEKARAANRAKRIATLTMFHDRLDEAIPNLDPNYISWRTAAEAMKIVVSELRADFDDLPRQRRELTGIDDGPIEVKDVTAAREVLANLIRNQIKRQQEAEPYIDKLNQLVEADDAVDGEIVESNYDDND